MTKVASWVLHPSVSLNLLKLASWPHANTIAGLHALPPSCSRHLPLLPLTYSRSNLFSLSRARARRHDSALGHALDHQPLLLQALSTFRHDHLDRGCLRWSTLDWPGTDVVRSWQTKHMEVQAERGRMEDSERSGINSNLQIEINGNPDSSN